MTRGTVLLFLALGAGIGGAQADPAGQACLRSDQLKQITMSGDSAATVKDKDGKTFHIGFTAPCAARHVGVFFLTEPENMQTCLKPGTALATNKSAACIVKSVEAVSTGPAP